MSTDAASAEAVAERVARRSFAPVHNGFTVDPDTWNDGVEDLQNEDWRVRALALRDLVREGRERPRAVRALLERDDEHVRHLAAAALGILGEESATEALSRLLRGDPDPVVRSQAAIALGQVGAPSEAVAGPLETEEHRDVRHQCAVALDRIRKNKPVEPALAEAFAAIDESTFGRVREGDPAPGFTLEDTEGTPWALSGALGDGFVVLIWVFADWCPVCHKEFHGLIDREERFRELGAKVAWSATTATAAA